MNDDRPQWEGVVAFMYGPLVLAGLTDSDHFLPKGGPDNALRPWEGAGDACACLKPRERKHHRMVQWPARSTTNATRTTRATHATLGWDHGVPPPSRNHAFFLDAQCAIW